MAREGVDFSSARPAADALRAAGRDFVVRYVSTPGNGKNITAGEAAYWQQNAVDVAIVFETTANRALSGAAAGAADANAARAQVRAVGGPADGGVIYFAVDVDTTSTAQRNAIDAYLAGCASVLGWDQVGVYGEYEVIDYVASHTACRFFWQTYAWSGGRPPHPKAQLYQYSNARHIGGVEVDFDQALADNFGQWNYRPAQEEGDMLSADDLKQALRDVLGERMDAGAATPRELFKQWPGLRATVAAGSDDEQHIIAAVTAAQGQLAAAIGRVQAGGGQLDPAAFADAVISELGSVFAARKAEGESSGG